MTAMHEMDGTLSTGSIPMSPRLPDEAARDAGASPVLLSWTDPEEGETLWVEMWATPEFVDDLLAQGFAVRAIGEDETATSLFVRILHRGAAEG